VTSDKIKAVRCGSEESSKSQAPTSKEAPNFKRQKHASYALGNW
jgi:hypothetical protein